MEKKNKELAAKLFSAKNEEVLSTIEYIKEKGNTELLYALLKLIQITDDSKIESKAKDIFFNLKDTNSVKVIMSAIENDEFSDIRSFLCSACWNNGLDYSNYLPVFVKLYIEEPFETAFDAFTIVENFTNRPEKKIIEEQIELLKSSNLNLSDEKKHLLVEFVNILQNMM